MLNNFECKFCDSTNANIIPVVFKNGVEHLEIKCGKCEKHNGYLSQNKDPEEFVFPFGKYKGKKLSEIAKENINYLMWAKDNMKAPNVVNKIIKYLEKENPL